MLTIIINTNIFRQSIYKNIIYKQILYPLANSCLLFLNSLYFEMI